MKNLIKNRVVVLVVAVCVICLVYTGIDKVIDGYSLYDNGDISGEENESGVDAEGVGVFADDEVDFVLEEEELATEDSTDGSEQVGDGSDSNEDGSDVVEGDAEIVESGAETEESGDADGLGSDGMDVKNKIYVYITGEVNVPGVVILDEGCRIVDAINAAGGTTSNANVSKVNLVYVLEDGMKVNIPNNSDLKNNPDFEYITTASGDGRNDSAANYGGGNADGAGSGSATSSEDRQEVVNINSATQTELESLPGIGPSLALKIINYRKENGKFSSIEDIKNVSGIGDAKFEELKRYISI